MIRIKALERETWENYELKFSYRTDGYYAFCVRDWDFQLIFHPYPAPVEKHFTDRLFSEWVENPLVFGAFDGERLAGVIECFLEGWNNRFRVTNLLVFEAFRRQGIGKLLMERAVAAAGQTRARAMVLETQTCNRGAIDFYRRQGFVPAGFDLCCYTNRDAEQTEVRLEMVKYLL